MMYCPKCQKEIDSYPVIVTQLLTKSINEDTDGSYWICDCGYRFKDIKGMYGCESCFSVCIDDRDIIPPKPKGAEVVCALCFKRINIAKEKGYMPFWTSESIEK